MTATTDSRKIVQALIHDDQDRSPSRVWTWLSSHRGQLQLCAMAAMWAIYFLLFNYFSNGGTYPLKMLVAIPSVILAYFYGMRVGMLVATLALALVALHLSAQRSFLEIFGSAPMLTGCALSIGTSALIGRIGELHRELRREIERHRRVADKLRLLADSDELTELYTRRKALEMIEEEMRISREQNTPFCVCFFDVDGLKLVNDTFGHQAGNELLETAARILRRSSRADDAACRLGGDELLLLLPRCGIKEAISVAQRIDRVCEHYNEHALHPFNVSISSGVIEYQPEVHTSVDKLIGASDQRMYDAKKGKRKLYVIRQ